MKAILRVLILLFLAVLLSGAPVRASEPVEPDEPETTLPAGYAVRSVGDMRVTIVDTPAGTSGLVDAIVVLSVAKALSERGEAGLVIGCVPVRNSPGVCGGTYFALSVPVVTVPISDTADLQLASVNGYR